ncbi:unnamed protein product, partial [Rotaria sp. Silwood1]
WILTVCFDVRKVMAQKIMRNYDSQGDNKTNYQDFHEI